MSANKATVDRYMDGFKTGDHGRILSCLTDDIEWIMPGFFHLSGKAAFDREIEKMRLSVARPSRSSAWSKKTKLLSQKAP